MKRKADNGTHILKCRTLQLTRDGFILRGGRGAQIEAKEETRPSTAHYMGHRATQTVWVAGKAAVVGRRVCVYVSVCDANKFHCLLRVCCGPGIFAKRPQFTP